MKTSKQTACKMNGFMQFQVWLLVILHCIAFANAAYLGTEQVIPDLTVGQLNQVDPNQQVVRTKETKEQNVVVESDATKLNNGQLPNTGNNLILPQNDANSLLLDDMGNERPITQLGQPIPENVKRNSELSAENENDAMEHLDQSHDYNDDDANIKHGHGDNIQENEDDIPDDSLEDTDSLNDDQDTNLDDSYSRTDPEEIQKYKEYEQKLLEELLGGTGGLVDELIGFVSGLVGTLVGGLSFALGLPFGGK